MPLMVSEIYVLVVKREEENGTPQNGSQSADRGCCRCIQEKVGKTTRHLIGSLQIINNKLGTLLVPSPYGDSDLAIINFINKF